MQDQELIGFGQYKLFLLVSIILKLFFGLVKGGFEQNKNNNWNFWSLLRRHKRICFNPFVRFRIATIVVVYPFHYFTFQRRDNVQRQHFRRKNISVTNNDISWTEPMVFAQRQFESLYLGT